MKLQCREHGFHFADDFDEAVGCDVWRQMGIEEMDAGDKRIIWDWLFTMPQDEIWIRTGFELSFAIAGRRVKYQNTWEDGNPDYQKMTRREQEDYQRRFFKEMYENEKKR